MKIRRPHAACLVVAAMLVLGGTATAFAVGGPSMTLTLDPPVPDGTNGWWRSAPLAYGTADADATLHYDWGMGEDTLAVTAEEPAYLGFSPEGTWTLSVFAEDSLGATGAIVSRDLKTDTVAPTRPMNLLPAAGIGAPGFRWDACSDGTSGLSHYVVYRNLVGPPFSEGDRVAFVDGGTSFGETDPLPSGFVYYGVRAFDEAGNASLMSDAIRLSTDVSAPTAPGDPQAWLNGRGFIRVSWEASYDRGSGIAGYVVQRAFPGQEMSTMATVPAGAPFWDDADLEAVAAGECSYAVFAVDTAGNLSAVAGPVVTGMDAAPPARPGSPYVVQLLPYLSPEAHLLPVAFSILWDEPADVGSGIQGYELAYGPDAAAPAFVRRTRTEFLDLRPTVESADWWFSVRAEDRAGNVSEFSEAMEQRAVTLDEVGGDDRIATAVSASRATFTGAGDVVIASAWSFPDGLAAAPLAGTLRAPVLLVGPGALRGDVLAELDRLDATRAWVIGGPSAVSDDTFAALDAELSGDVTRISGTDRYSTAAAVAAKVGQLRGAHPARTIIVSGQNFPDALSAGPLAYVTGWPIVFATSTDLPTVSRIAIANSEAPAALVIGGTSVVSEVTEASVPSPLRLSGSDRYETSALVARWAVDGGFLTAARPVLATGLTFPDGLSAGPFAGERAAPVLLTRDYELSFFAESFLHDNARNVRRITALGRTMNPYPVYEDAWRAVRVWPQKSKPDGPKAPAPARRL